MDHEHGVVLARGGTGAGTEDDEAGLSGVATRGGSDDFEVMQFCAEGGAEGGMAGGIGGKGGRSAGTGAFGQVSGGETFGQPGTTLGEHLGMTMDDFNLFTIALGHDDRLGAPKNFRVDLQVGIDEAIQSVMHGTFSGVLDGKNAVVHDTRGDAVEDAFGAGVGDVFDAVAKFIDGDLMGPRSSGAEIGDLHARLQGQRGAHDLAVDGADGFFREATFLRGVERCEFAQELLLTSRHIDIETLLFFDGAHNVDEFGAFVEKLNELLVNGVDLSAGFVQGHEGREGKG